MSEPVGSHPVVHGILDQVTGESVAALRSSGASRILQPASHGGLALHPDEFVLAVCELAALDGSLGWLAAVHNAAAHEVARLPHAADEVWNANPDALVATGHRGSGELIGGRLTGRWASVVGAEQADWLLLPTDHLRRVLMPRSQVRIEPAEHVTGLHAAGVGDVIADNVGVDDGHVFTFDLDTATITAAGAAAAVVGSADGVWRNHVDQVRARLDISYGGDDVTDEAAAQVARAASDIDAARQQVMASLDRVSEAGETSTWAFEQSIARARAAADRLFASSRHALNSSDPVTQRWRDVHAGCRLAAPIIATAGASAS